MMCARFLLSTASRYKYALTTLLALTAVVPVVAQAPLQVTYGQNGVQTIAFQGQVLEDLGSNPADAFHIWHMKSTDLNGNAMSDGQYGWGESNSGVSWDPSSHTETYRFDWGSIATHFVQSGNNLDMVVTETNFAGSGIVFDGAEIYPLALHFPSDPSQFYGYTQTVITTTGPGVSVADYGSGVVTSVIPDESAALYGGWKAAGANTYTPIMSASSPDGLATFLPHNDKPVQPGQSFTYTVSLRWTAEGTPADASDAYRSFAAKYPSQMTWTDHRIIGTAYLASSPDGQDITQPGGFPTNPRRYFNDSNMDITSLSGMRVFQNRILDQAASNVTNARAMNAQGMVTWDIEGEQYPQSTSYVCSPDKVATVAPEMEATVLDASSPYHGQKLDDAYFKIMSSAGLKLGVCLRPQVFTQSANGTARQIDLSGNAAIVANLEAKAHFANTRWGVTIFYVDSNVDPNGGTLDPAIYQQLITDLPSFLFIPEESTPRYYAYTAPFFTFLFHTDLGTPASTYLFYPHAFGANLVNDVNPNTLANYQKQLTQAVTKGDILMGHADYWQDNDPTLVSIYQAAGVTGSEPAKVTPVLMWSAPGGINYGTRLTSTQLNATASVPGRFVYSPAAGTLPPAGISNLTATFIPTDTTNYSAVTGSVELTVMRAVPTFSWATPASIVKGTALSGAQLNANASVPGMVIYTPGAGTILPVGNTTLSARFAPTDSKDYASVSTNVTLAVGSVQQKTPVILWSNPAVVPYGTALCEVQLNAASAISGTFKYSVDSGTVLPAGINTVQAVFTPADPATYSIAKATAIIQVAKVAPALTWAAPAPITSGTALSAAQLNATTNVPGRFTYTPSLGTAPAAGLAELSVVFNPTDTANYTARTTGVSLSVMAQPESDLAILYPMPGQTVSGGISVVGNVNLNLDSAGSYLMVDGVEVGSDRVVSGPYNYDLDTTSLSNGPHLLQLWGHDVGDNTTLSGTMMVNVAN
jgi:hypothetical protein